MRFSLSSFVQIGLWTMIVVLAFVMQVAPFLLILTMINIAFGISSGTVLIVIPTALFAMLIGACLIAERKRRDWRPAPPTERRHPDEAMQHTAPCMLPYVKRQRIY